MKNNFIEKITNGYEFNGASIVMGAAVINGETVKDLLVKIPLKTLNRHGLITGATGTGKTKSLQHLCEMLSKQGTSVLVMDMKGDVSGLSQMGQTDSRIQERVAKTGVAWNPNSFPVEFLSISNEQGVRMRATVSEFGPVLFSKILELNDTQSSVMSLIFKFADDNFLPIVDLKDIKKLIQYLTSVEGKEELKKDYGAISTASTGLILRKIIEIEEQGASMFFGEKSFDVEDFLRKDGRGYGFINILRLMDIQNKPKMFSTFMLSLLAEIFQKFPEEGDLDQPKLVIFIDEAHLIFKEASKTSLSQLETVIKLIRSKGVGIIFCTQSPNDIPKVILSQLGLKVQHALRAFTSQDRKAIKLVAENFPTSEFYDVDSLITSLGIGESLITALNERGEPTPLVHALHSSPESRMDTITQNEMEHVINKSSLIYKYDEVIDRDTAYELLSKRMAQSTVIPANSDYLGRAGDAVKDIAGSKFAKSLAKSVATSFVRNVTGQITRGILGALLRKSRA
jgi:uncharacterized protein